MGVKRRACVDVTDSPIMDFAGLIMLAIRQGCHGCDSGVVLIES
jgi:hypothetical protein